MENCEGMFCAKASCRWPMGKHSSHSLNKGADSRFGVTMPRGSQLPNRSDE
jgi:hypothetical protein